MGPDPYKKLTYFTYDEIGRMTSVTRNMKPDTTALTEGATEVYYTYDANGNVTTRKLRNGCFTYYAYDPLDRPTSMLNCLADGSPLAYFQYTYDPAGRITRCVRESGDVVYYGYDAADRLTSETWKDSGGGAIYAFAWDYDPVGNRTYQSQNSVQTYYNYNEGNELTQYHELPADAWTYFAYDSRGNCLRIQEPSGTTYFEYSDADLVTGIKYPGGTTNTFRYDGRLHRCALTDSDGTSMLWWDLNRMNLLFDAADNATMVPRRVYYHGRTPIDGIGSTQALSRNGSQHGACHRLRNRRNAASSRSMSSGGGAA